MQDKNGGYFLKSKIAAKNFASSFWRLIPKNGISRHRFARARTVSRGAPCALRRGVVDVVDVVGSSKAGKGAASPAGRPVDDIDDIDDVDDPRTEGRRRRVRPDSGPPARARLPEAPRAPCGEGSSMSSISGRGSDWSRCGGFPRISIRLAARALRKAFRRRGIPRMRGCRRKCCNAARRPARR